MKFIKFAKILEKIEEESSRNKMIDIVADLFEKLSSDHINESLYLIQGRVVPKFIDLEFNVARKLMIQALSKAYDKDEEKIDYMFSQKGDLGLVSEELNNKKTSDLDILKVYRQLKEIALYGGEGSQAEKIDGIADLLKECDSLSSRYVIRMILGDLRLGLSDKSILDAISVWAVGDKSKRKVLDNAYGVRNDIGLIAELVIKKGMKRIERIKVEPGIPVAAMLCEREETIEKISERIPETMVQPKYDGLRAQIHFDKDGIGEEISKITKQKALFDEKEEEIKSEIFSRNLGSLTKMFPEITQAVENLNLDSVVFDGEIIAYDENTSEFLPFQETIQRRRKYKVDRKAQDIPVRLYVYDILYINGEDITAETFEERMKILEKVINEADEQNVIFLTPTDKTRDTRKIKELFKEYVEEGLEGIILKSPSSKYKPGKRGFDWIKYKKSSKGFVVDTIDAVVMGYYFGRGSRAKFGIGAFLIGILNKKDSSYESIVKVGTGITDDQWPQIKERLDKLSLEGQPKMYKVSKELYPDVWVEPEVVVEVEADEITESTNHLAAEKNGRGYSLRFPRLKIFDRIDKDGEDITTAEEIQKFYKISKEKSGK